MFCGNARAGRRRSDGGGSHLWKGTHEGLGDPVELSRNEVAEEGEMESVQAWPEVEVHGRAKCCCKVRVKQAEISICIRSHPSVFVSELQ